MRVNLTQEKIVFSGGSKLALLSFLICFRVVAADVHVSAFDGYNTETTAQGCQEADPDKVRCVHVGSQGISSGEMPEAGRRVSVTSPHAMTEQLRMMKIPMIAVNDTVDKRYREFSAEKILLRNLQFGMKLGNLAEKIYPAGGRICFLSPHGDPIAEKRIRGIRIVLSGDDQYPEKRPLSGENGWKECQNSPRTLPAGDFPDADKALMDQLNEDRPDLLVAVSHWPLADLVEAESRENSRKHRFDPEIAVIVSGNGKGYSLKDIDILTGTGWLKRGAQKQELNPEVYIYLPDLMND